MKGKTKEQLGPYINMAWNQSLTQVTHPQTPSPAGPPQVQPPQQPPQAPQAPTLDPDTWNTDPAAATQAYVSQQLAQAQQTQFQPAMDQIYQSQAQLARSTVATRRADEFNRWGPEILAELNKIPPQMQTVDLIEQAVDLVQGRHAREVANETIAKRVEEEIERRMAGGQLRSGDGAGGASPRQDDVLDLDTLPVGYRDRWVSSGLVTPKGQITDEFKTIAARMYPHEPSVNAAVQAYLKKVIKNETVEAQGE